MGARDACPRVARGCAGVLHPVAGVVPNGRHDDGRRVLLPGGLAARAVGARFREYPETRIRVRAHGGIRLGVHGTTGGAVRLRVARARGSSGRGPGAEGRPLHAFRNASRVAHASAPGNVDDRCARPADESRVTRARHLELAGLPSICRANRDRAWQAIRTQSERVGLADRQRTEPLRPLVFVRTGEPGEVSRLAPRPVQDDRCAEHRVGKCLLVADVQRLRADRHPEPRRTRRGGERACAARLPAVVRGRSGRLHSVPGGSAAPPHSGQWITSNFMHTHREVYPPLSGKDLDIITWTIYPAHGNRTKARWGSAWETAPRCRSWGISRGRSTVSTA